jgi:hypothetical protein
MEPTDVCENKCKNLVRRHKDSDKLISTNNLYNSRAFSQHLKIKTFDLYYGKICPNFKPKLQQAKNDSEAKGIYGSISNR